MTTPESFNTKIVANLLSFLLVTHTVPSDTRFTIYQFSKWTGAETVLDRLATGVKSQVWGTR
jgi:hypothetical protein